MKMITTEKVANNWFYLECPECHYQITSSVEGVECSLYNAKETIKKIKEDCGCNKKEIPKLLQREGISK
jgi:hypothetical protein